MKKKIISLSMAAALVASLAGCAISTPSTVGDIGGVEIPAGVYLLAQYNAYNAGASAATLEDGVTSSDVKKVLATQMEDVTIGDETFSGTVAEYVEKVTARTLEHYAAAELKFEELGGELTEEQMESISASAESQWSSSEDLYAANGIGKTSLEAYLTNQQKAEQILELIYGEDGTTPLTEDDYTQYIDTECTYLNYVDLPLFDYSSYTFADDDQSAQIGTLAEECAAYLNGETASEETAEDTEAEEDTAEAAEEAAAEAAAEAPTMIEAAQTYVPQAMAVLGSELSSDEALYYYGSSLVTPDDLSTFTTSDDVTIPDLLADKENNQWVSANLGMYYLVASKDDPYNYGTASELAENYGLLDVMKGDEVDEMLYTEGAALAHNLNSSAVSTYAANKITKNA